MSDERLLDAFGEMYGDRIRFLEQAVLAALTGLVSGTIAASAPCIPHDMAKRAFEIALAMDKERFQR